MKNPVLGHNQIQSYIDFETTEGKMRFGLEGKKIFFEINTIKSYIFDAVNSTIPGQYVYWTDGTYIYRAGGRNGSIVFDRSITALGFAGDENTDWENLGGQS